MTRTLNRLSALKVGRLKTKGLYADGGGLYLKVGATGGKSWIFRWFENGRTRDHELGPFHTIGLPKARELARDCRELRLQDINPVEHKRAALAARKMAEAKAVTFKECADAYIAAHEAGWHNVDHRNQWDRTLSQHVHPTLGSLPVAEIDTPLVLKTLEPIWRTTTETASRVRARIESILSWAKVAGYRTGENPARWRGHLDQLLPAKGKLQKVTHHPALPYTEIAALMRSLGDEPGERALRFLILTAARTGEVLGATRAEIDTATKTWTIPGRRMKAGNEHRVPLSGVALALLADRDPLFGRRLAIKGMYRALDRLGREGVTVHGFRSTFRDWASETTSFPSEVVEMALAHAVGNKVEAAYRRGDLFEKRRLLMDGWADYCSRPPAQGAAVVPLSRRRR